MIRVWIGASTISVNDLPWHQGLGVEIYLQQALEEGKVTLPVTAPIEQWPTFTVRDLRQLPTLLAEIAASLAPDNPDVAAKDWIAALRNIRQAHLTATHNVETLERLLAEARALAAPVTPQADTTIDADRDRARQQPEDLDE